MKKFKVIEQSRFLNQEAMLSMKGGAYCNEDIPYISASCPPVETCGPAVVQGFNSCSISIFNFCGEAVDYSNSGGMCGPMVGHGAHCGEGFIYG